MYKQKEKTERLSRTYAKCCNCLPCGGSGSTEFGAEPIPWGHLMEVQPGFNAVFIAGKRSLGGLASTGGAFIRTDDLKHIPFDSPNSALFLFLSFSSFSSSSTLVLNLSESYVPNRAARFTRFGMQITVLVRLCVISPFGVMMELWISFDNSCHQCLVLMIS